MPGEVSVSDRELVRTREQLEALPVGTTLVDRWGDPLVKVDSYCFAVVNPDRTTPGLPCGPEPWRYYDLAEVCGERSDVSWLPMTIHQMVDVPGAVPVGGGERPSGRRIARPPLPPPDVRAQSGDRSESTGSGRSHEPGVQL